MEEAAEYSVLQVVALGEGVAALGAAHLAGPSSAAILQEYQRLSLGEACSGVGQVEVEEESFVREVPVSVVEVASA